MLPPLNPPKRHLLRPLALGLTLAALAAQPQEPKAPEADFKESIDVRLVELYVAVTDRDGQPVRGLGKGDFTLAENGAAQELESATDSQDLPVTLGLAVDTSASMFVKLPAAVRAAGELVAALRPGRDRAFLVGFGSEAELAQSTTGDLTRVGSALRNLEAKGMTPLWSSVSLSLDELRSARGKRAVVIFFDGADDDGGGAFKTAYERARKARVPIYLIVMNNEAARRGGKDFQTRAFISRLERMAKAGGGRVFFVPTRSDLSPIYREIEAEIRSAYLLTYYPTIPLEQGGRRDVAVKVAKKGVSVRTVSGYEPGS